MSRTPRKTGLMRKTCSAGSWVPTYDVSQTQFISSMTPMDSTGYCGKDQSQVGVIVITKEPGEDEDKPAIGGQILIPFGGTLPCIPARLWCTFTTASMAIAYASSFDRKPKVPSREPSWSGRVINRTTGIDPSAARSQFRLCFYRISVTYQINTRCSRLWLKCSSAPY